MDNKFNLFSDEQTMRFCSYSMLNHYVICFQFFFQKLHMILTLCHYIAGCDNNSICYCILISYHFNFRSNLYLAEKWSNNYCVNLLTTFYLFSLRCSDMSLVIDDVHDCLHNPFM